MSTVPNFFIIGASKCGTTALYNTLARQDKCCMSLTKEPFFFNRKERDIKEYLSLFEYCIDNIAIGEATPIYSETTYFSWIPEAIYNMNPSAKIIYIIRHPHDRLKSIWKQTLSTGHFYKKTYYHRKMPLRFKKAIFDYPPFLEACRYWTHIQNYRRFFDDTNIKILYFEDYVQNTSEIMRELIDFLDLPNFKSPYLDAQEKNMSKGKNVANPIFHWINDTPILRQIKDKIPSVARNFIKKNTVLPIPSNPQFNDKVKAKIRAELKEEIASLFEYTGKPSNFWKL